MTLIDVQMCSKGFHELTPENIGRDQRCKACERAGHRRRANIKAGRHPRETLLRIPVAPLRDRYVAAITMGETTPTQVARALEWFCSGSGGRAPQPDTARLRRALGLIPNISHPEGERTETYATEIDYERAQAICLAIPTDPAGVGV